MSDPGSKPIASYQADPESVGRVLLLYSGGLDTSVMLRWIQERYGAEIVALTVNLGQPDEDWDVIVGKARDLGAVDAIVVDAREEFARDYVLPAIKANALYGGGYPLFTALGRPLIAKLAVEHARRTGCDTIAHGCTGKGNDQVRIEATVATLDPELKLHRAGARVEHGPRGGDRLRARARDPGQGGTEAPPYSIDDNLWGRSSEGGAIEDLDQPPRDDVFQLVTRPEEAPDEPELVRVGFERGCAGLDRRRAPRAGRAARARGRARAPPRRRDRRPRRGPDRRAEDPRRLRGAGGGDRPRRAPRAREARVDDPPEQLQARARGQVGLPLLRRALARAAALGPRRLHGVGERARDRRGHAEALQGLGDARGAQLAVRAVRPLAGLVRRVGRRVQPGREPGVHRAVHAADPDGAAPEGAAPATSGPEAPHRSNSGRMEEGR